MSKKKAQMKIQQMAFMLLATTLFFIMVGVVILGIKMSSVKNSATALEEENAMLLATKIANSPEFSCGEVFGSSRTNCIDTDKIMILKNMDSYKNFWGTETNIEIRKLSGGDVLCSSKNYPKCDIINLQSKRITGEYSNFVSMCWKELENEESYNKCALAKIMITYKDWEDSDE